MHFRNIITNLIDRVNKLAKKGEMCKLRSKLRSKSKSL